MKQPEVSVGIVSASKMRITLHTTYLCQGEPINGPQEITLHQQHIQWNGNPYTELVFTPIDDEACFSLEDVTIGLHFHWERQETQSFRGILKLIVHHDQITAINILPVEEYLISVISSEMNANSPIEFLKSHAVISRSWLLAQIEKRQHLHEEELPAARQMITSDTEIIRWYDREDHQLFDVCADDHCQRYQGITRASKPEVQEAVKSTYGQVLMYDNHICDARFSKCCGGITEEFQYCWEDQSYPYLSAVADSETNTYLPNLSIEHEAEKWIRTTPPSICNTHNQTIIRQILNQYDQETVDFFRWRVDYTQAEIASLIEEKGHLGLGRIVHLLPLERGKSGRISKLQMVGTDRTITVGKELEIRKLLSPTHLFSSAFIVDEGPLADGIPQSFHFTGAGWGHGVGLCQIGAAVMGANGYDYNQILLHYYKDSEIRKLY